MEKGTQEWFDTRSEMEQRDQEHRIYLHQYYAELLSHYQEQWGKADLKEQERIATKGIEELYDKRLIEWQEYQEARAAIALQYRKKQMECGFTNVRRMLTRPLRTTPTQTTRMSTRSAWA